MEGRELEKEEHDLETEEREEGDEGETQHEAVEESQHLGDECTRSRTVGPAHTPDLDRAPKLTTLARGGHLSGGARVEDPEDQSRSATGKRKPSKEVST